MYKIRFRPVEVTSTTISLHSLWNESESVGNVQGVIHYRHWDLM